ncbi:MAG: prepilin-type N-terminal cleavage/methylation domain-containing protein [bacterium]|nr:prepilin-type N-terminal cleavage/methylation domain-containing protein [bacterium]
MRPIHKADYLKLDQFGFTLIELVIVIVVLGIIAAVAIPRFGALTENSKVTATQSEMQTLKRAIVGNPEAVSGGEFVDRGYEGDVGFLPNSLSDLVSKPDSVAAYDKLTRLGWNGPYIDGSADYLNDSWGNSYSYDIGNRNIMSVGGTDTIVVNF